MIIFLLIYVLFLLISLSGVINGNAEKVLLFIVFSLPIYYTTLCVSLLYGLGSIIPLLQASKEIMLLLTLALLIFNRKKNIKLHIIDKLILGYFILSLIYTLIPLGTQGVFDKLIALKSISFFPFIYFTGRLLDYRKINFNYFFSFICLVTILAGCVLAIEAIRNEHLQLYTGFADFNKYFLKEDPSGHYGLNWTFETSLGVKRFASFYANPLELGVNTVCAVSVIIALATQSNNRFLPERFQIITLAFTTLAIFLALSRASFVSYFLILYVYGHLMQKRKLIKVFHYTLLVACLVVFLFLQGEFYDWIMNTIDFTDSSSAFHILQWLEGIDAIVQHPLGLGLGMSGRVSFNDDSNIGGENQFLIIGVQIGAIGLLLYLLIFVLTIVVCTRLFSKSTSKVRKPALALLFIKIGTIIPMLTSNAESYIYMSYLSWILTGIVVTMYTEEAYIPIDTTG